MRCRAVRSLFAAAFLVSSSLAARAGPITLGEVLPDTSGAGGLRSLQDQTALPKVTPVEVGDVTGTICDCGSIPGEGLAAEDSILNRRPGRIGLFTGVSVPGVGLIVARILDRRRISTTNIREGSRQVSEVPEPATLVLLASGLGALGGALRRRRKAKP